MKPFSQRIGKTAPKTIIQVESMDDDLKNGLWNSLLRFPLNSPSPYLSIEQCNTKTKDLIYNIWTNFFKHRLDELPPALHTWLFHMKEAFFAMEWYEVYDFIEFVPANYGTSSRELIVEKFVSDCNQILEKELSAYRFINGQITAVTNPIEVESIEDALATTNDNKLKPVHLHLSRALELFSDRHSPDYRNSIKESISAIESYCSILTGDPKATLGQALKKFPLHQALIKSFTSLYGYTSDAGGIRHALLEEDSISHEDAKFMLVTCSAFISYLKQKEAKTSA